MAYYLLKRSATSVAQPETAQHVAAANLSKAAIVGAWRLVSNDYSGPNGALNDPVFGFDPGARVHPRALDAENDLVA